MFTTYCKKNCFGWFAGFFLVVILTPSLQAAQLTETEREWLRKKGEITFVSQTLYPPFEFIDQDNSRKGMCIEMARWISTESGFKVSFRDMSFKKAQEAVLSGRADVLTSLFYSQKRDNNFDFTDTTWQVPALIFVRSERPDITQLKDLQGKKIAMQKGDYAAEFLHAKNIEFELIPTATFAEAVDLVIAFKADAVIGDKQIVLYHLFSNNLNQHIKSVGEPLYVGLNCMATRDGETELTGILKKGLSQARKHGIFNQITKKWTGVQYSTETSWINRHSTSIIIILSALGLLTLGIFIWNFYLRRAVDSRTRELARSEEKFRAMVESSNDLIWETDKDINFTYLSPNVKQLLGYDPEELIGKSIYQLMDHEEASRAREEYRKTLKEQHISANLINTVPSKNGKKVTFSTSSVPFFNEDGFLLGYRGINRDITLQEEEENRLQQLEQQLQQAHKMEAIGLMAGGVAHDLNNILSGIVGYPDLLLMQIPKESELRKPITAIRESGKKAAEVVADLLTVARGVAATREIINLNTLVNRYLGSPECLKLKSIYTNIDFMTELEPELLNILGSPIHIQKCLMNLVHNAAEAIDSKGRIVISTKNRYIDQPIAENHYIKSGEYAVLRVSDSGSGISDVDLKHIFEPFYTKKKMGRSGTGLGLAVVWNTAQDCGGGVTAESGKNGAVFTLYLPATREELTTSLKEEQTDKLKGHGEKILIVDDEPQQRDIAEKMLTILGYSVQSVGSGEAAIGYLKKNSVDLLILDMIMEPGLNGRQTYAEIIKFNPQQKAIIASGFSENREVEKTQTLGAGEFIKKPYLLTQIGLAVKQALSV
ncbi:MAG: transporter substrate-binding domain-containing protein [Pseudomonadota bacterium]|nr:transporter substrate-binding domain-containing protein [Pseudomonadota bacterium]